MQRRTFLSVAAAAIPFAETWAKGLSIPVIDSHIHLFDPTRPQGVPYPIPKMSIYRTFLPADYRKIAEPYGIKGVISVECSPWVEDNYWNLEVAASDKILVGTVGFLPPGKPDFSEHFPRLRKNPLFLGIRIGVWSGNIAQDISKPEYISDLKKLAEAGLTLDTVGGAGLLADLVRLTDKVPDLRIVVDHLPGYQIPWEPAALAKYEESLREIGKRPQVYVKITEIYQHIDENGRRIETGGRIPRDLDFYRSKLDSIYEAFGPDRVLFGSDWLNSETKGTFKETMDIVKEYFTAKGQDVMEKFYWKNSVPAYHWVKRKADQPQL